jgi:hypothetical protein
MNGEPIKEHPLFIGPNHEVGISPDMEVREVESTVSRRRARAEAATVCELHPIALEGALQCLS